MIRLINITLALVAFYGAFIAFREARLNEGLAKQHRWLAAEIGFLDVSDPSKVHVVALASEDPLHFRWRIYLPEKYSVVWRTSEMGRGNNTSTGTALSSPWTNRTTDLVCQKGLPMVFCYGCSQ